MYSVMLSYINSTYYTALVSCEFVAMALQFYKWSTLRECAKGKPYNAAYT